MPLMLLAGFVLCSLLFVVYTLVCYFEAVSPKRQTVAHLQQVIDTKRSRLDEYEQRIDVLNEQIPQDETRLGHLEDWVQLLSEQKERLEGLELEKTRAEFQKKIAFERDKEA